MEVKSMLKLFNHRIFNGVSFNEFRRIATCEYTKAAYNTFSVTHKYKVV